MNRKIHQSQMLTSHFHPPTPRKQVRLGRKWATSPSPRSLPWRGQMWMSRTQMLVRNPQMSMRQLRVVPSQPQMKEPQIQRKLP